VRAIVFEQFGEPVEVLELRDLRSAEPGPGEVRIRMLASPVNPSDLMVVRGIYAKLPQLPATPGFEGVGIVESAGGGLLGKYFIGKRVAVLNRQSGNWCDQTVVPAKQVIPLAQDLPTEQAAMFFVNPASAFIMTRKVLAVPKGEWLLQTAAGSALGRMVIRLGNRFGFRTLNVVRREQQVDELKALGAGAVLTFDPDRHQTEQLRDDVRAITNDQSLRFAIDPVGGETGSAVIHCLGVASRMIVFGTLSNDPLSFSSRVLMDHGIRLEGFWLARWMARQRLLSKLRLVKQITRLIREGILSSDVRESFPLEQISEAVRTAEETASGGKVLLRIAER